MGITATVAGLVGSILSSAKIIYEFYKAKTKSQRETLPKSQGGSIAWVILIVVSLLPVAVLVQYLANQNEIQSLKSVNQQAMRKAVFEHINDTLKQNSELMKKMDITLTHLREADTQFKSINMIGKLQGNENTSYIDATGTVAQEIQALSQEREMVQKAISDAQQKLSSQ